MMSLFEQFFHHDTDPHEKFTVYCNATIGPACMETIVETDERENPNGFYICARRHTVISILLYKL